MTRVHRRGVVSLLLGLTLVLVAGAVIQAPVWSIMASVGGGMIAFGLVLVQS